MEIRKKLSSENGFTMVEVLVATVILLIGLLGVAGMQINGMKGNHNSFLRSQAQQYAYEVVDMMRANRTAATANQADTDAAFYTTANYPNNYNITFAAFNGDDGTSFENSAGVAKTGLVLADLNEWRRGIVGAGNTGSGLPGGQGQVIVSANADNAAPNIENTWTVTVTVQWTDGRFADDPTPSVVVETKL